MAAATQVLAPALGTTGRSAFQLAFFSMVALVLAVFVGTFGYFAPLAVAYLALPVLVLWKPQWVAIALLFLLIAAEPGGSDFVSRFAGLLQFFPEPVAAAMPLTVSPSEVLIVFLALSMALPMRWRTPMPRRRLPWAVWGLVAMMTLGLAYGLYRGGDAAIAYHELRGLIFGSMAFFIAWRMIPQLEASSARNIVIVTSVALAVVVIGRYLLVTRDSFSSTLTAFAHEDVTFFAVGASVAVGLAMRARSPSALIGAMLLLTVLVGATMVTGRRSGTLVVLTVAVVTFWLLLPKRPVLLTAVGVGGALLFALYLMAFWNSQYGTISQPARAIRSQIAPSERDLSSNVYRDVEAYNVTQTIKTRPVTGVGFGKPFFEFVPLIQTYGNLWSLQLYTPHNGLLWLWLKLGIVGMATALTVWVLAFRRCISVIRSYPRGITPIAPLAAASALAVFLAFAQVDLLLSGTRGVVPLMVTLAVAFSFDDSPDVERDRARGEPV